MSTFRVGIVGVVVVMCLVGMRSALVAQDGAALTGQVSSEAEGNMEGVLVTLRPSGGNHTVTVVSDAQGRYSFPRTHIPAGQYAVSIRALGYDLASADLVTVSGNWASSRAPTRRETTTLDVRLQPTADLPSQLTSLDWVSLFPLTPEEKDKLVHQPASCNYCHSYQRIVNSRHDADGLVRAMERMKTYYPDGTAVSNDGRGGIERWTTFGDSTGAPVENPQQAGIGNPNWSYSPVPMTEFAEIWAKVNLGNRETYPFEVKPVLPRPTGKGTRVIITQWDMPRKDARPHDSAIDAQGNLWYADEGHAFIGMLDLDTNTIKEYPLGELPPEHLHGSRDITIDENGNPWVPMRVPGGGAFMTKVDRETGELTTIDGVYSQFASEGPDNTIWALGFGSTTAIDADTMEVIGEFVSAPGYQQVVTSTRKICAATNEFVECLNTRTGESRRVDLPNGPNAFGRRGKIDAHDRYWFSEYSADAIGMLDTNTYELKEWPLRQFATAYSVSAPDMHGHVYAGSNMSDRVMRLDPSTGEVVEYLMPTELDTKEIQIDPTATDRPVILFTNMRTARLVRVEPLD